MAERLTLHVYKSGTIHRFEVSKTTTIKEILDTLQCQESTVVVFTSVPDDKNSSPIVNFKMNFTALNMWYESPIEITVHDKADTANYNVERYAMYNS
jgi:hypothetical protein